MEHFLKFNVFCYNFVDINECSKSLSICHQNANCTNADGFYSCQCSSGYFGDGIFNCTGTSIKINSQFTFVKPATFVNIICNNILFHFLLLHHRFANFVDINECTKSPSVCHQNANCTNTDGSYACRCSKGYSGDGKVDCTGTVLLRNYFIVMFPSLIFKEITAWEGQCVIFLFVYDFK